MNNLYRISGVILIMFLIYSCKKEKPRAITSDVSDISFTTASSGGEVTNEGEGPVFARGVCWNTSENPTVGNNKTSDGTGAGSFTSLLTQLAPGTKYYVKAYAANSIGYGYGNQVSFTTESVLLPNMTTETVSSIQPNSSVSGGNIPGEIYSNGGGEITARGVCWATTGNPTINNYKTTDGSGFGSFTSNLINLLSNTTYYVRAYATNSAGTGYGEQMQFITLIDYTGQSGTVSDVDGNTYHTLGIGSQIWITENLKTTRYPNGDLIDTVISEFSSYQMAYNGEKSNVAVYGRLYSYSVFACPTGWHIPNDSEWITLATYLGGVSVAGGKLKETGTAHWSDPNAGATNVTGFTALPGGYNTHDLGSYGYWWSADDESIQTASSWRLGYNSNSLDHSGSEKASALSVRCVKNK